MNEYCPICGHDLGRLPGENGALWCPHCDREAWELYKRANNDLAMENRRLRRHLGGDLGCPLIVQAGA